MNLSTLNSKLAWAVLLAGLSLATLAGAFVVMTGQTSVLLVAMFGAVAAQAGKITILAEAASPGLARDSIRELAAA